MRDRAKDVGGQFTGRGGKVERHPVHGDQRHAARLFAVTSTMPRTEVGEFLLFGNSAEVAQEIAAVQQGLGESEFAAAWAEGQAMTPQEAVAYGATDRDE